MQTALSNFLEYDSISLDEMNFKTFYGPSTGNDQGHSHGLHMKDGVLEEDNSNTNDAKANQQANGQKYVDITDEDNQLKVDNSHDTDMSLADYIFQKS